MATTRKTRGVFQRALANCDGKPLSEIFGERRPAIYELGKAQADVFKDSKVEVYGSNNGGAAKDIVAPCDVAKSTPSTARATKLVARTVDGGVDKLVYFKQGANFKLEADSPSTTLSHLTDNLTASPDGREFYAWKSSTNGSGFVKKVHVTALGEFVTDGSDDAVPNANYNGLSLSGTGQHVYLTSSSRSYQYSKGVHNIEEFNPFQCETFGAGKIFSFAGFAYFVSGQTLRIKPEPTDGNLLCNGIGAQQAALLPFSVKKVLRRGGVLYLSGQASLQTVIAAYLADGLGNLVPVGGIQTVGGLQTDFALSARGDFLFAANQNGGSIDTFPINPDGSVGTVVKSLGITSPRIIQSDFSGDTLFAIHSTNLLSQYRVEADGALVLVPQGAEGLGVYSDILTIPIF